MHGITIADGSAEILTAAVTGEGAAIMMVAIITRATNIITAVTIGTSPLKPLAR
jgi:hypothetical protein